MGNEKHEKQGGQGDPQPDKGKDLEVTVYDEDEGTEPVRLHAGPGTPVSTMIDRYYRERGLERKDDDRLHCIATGESVFPHADEHLGDYATGACGDLKWGFARGTGGA